MEKIPEQKTEPEIWEQWQSLGSREARDQLIEQYRDFSRSLARVVIKSRFVHDRSCLEDCYQAGYLALIESIDHYDPGKGVLFTTYASYRIKGAIHDCLNQSSEVSSLGDYKRKILNERARSLSVTEDGGDFKSLLNITLDIASTELMRSSLENHKLKYQEELIDTSYHTPVTYSIGCELWNFIEQLGNPETLIMKEHYLNNRLFSEIAEVLSLTPGRISQIHAKAIRKLRELYKSDTKLDKKI